MNAVHDDITLESGAVPAGSALSIDLARPVSERLRGRSVVADTDLAYDEILELIGTALVLKQMRAHRMAPPEFLLGRTLGMIFQHPSTRTRNAFQAGMEQLGGHATFLGINDLQIKRGETVADTARIMSRYVDGIALRVANHDALVEFASGATVPVFNALSEKCHPLEALSDLLTLRERFGGLAGLKLAYVGDGNNVCHSLMIACATVGISVAVAAPAHYQPDPDVVAVALERGKISGAAPTVMLTEDPREAANGADAIYTDVHESMGQVNEPAKATALTPYKVTKEVMAAARSTAVFMHCLPMHRGEEVDPEVADGPRSIIFDQAENRLHLHKALLLHTLWRGTKPTNA